MDDLRKRLTDFEKKHGVKTKGPLCVMLVVSDIAKKRGLPLASEQLLTKAKGQVRGLSKSNVQSILKKYGITRVLAEEGGRTSRGSIQNMTLYVDFLNGLHEAGLMDFDAIMEYWVEKVRRFFAGKPFRLRYDAAKSLGAIVRDLFG